MVGNAIGDNLEGMVSVCNAVRKYLKHMEEDGSRSIFKDDQLDDCSKSSHLTVIPGFSSVGNWKIDDDILW